MKQPAMDPTSTKINAGAKNQGSLRAKPRPDHNNDAFFSTLRRYKVAITSAATMYNRSKNTLAGLDEM
jgi:hypothetical protein